MPYQRGHYYNFGRTYACISYPKMWFPGGGGDVNDPYRNEITYAYFSLFGRYGEEAGVEGWLYTWLYGGGQQAYGTIYNMVRIGGDRNQGGSGELNDVAAYGRHTGMSTGSCPLPPVIYNFNIDRQDGTDAGVNSVPYGQYVVLRWTTGGATSATISGGIGTVATSGSRIYYPPNAGSYFFTLTVVGPGGSASGTYGFIVSAPPPSVSISASPTAIVRGNSSQLSWYITNATSASVSNIGQVSTSSTGSTVQPFSTTTYTLTASGPGGTRNASVTVTVYIPPQINFTADRTEIVVGESTYLRWSVSGDADRMSISPGLGTYTNLSSFQQVSPTITTTYTAVATGLGGRDSKELTIVVIQPPTVSLNGPFTANYGSTITLSYSATNAVTSLTIEPTFRYTDGSTSSGSSYNVSLPIGQSVNGSYIYDMIPWGDKGPSAIDFRLTAVGYSRTVNGQIDYLTKQTIISVSVNIDETPNLINIPESDNKLKDQDPVISPTEESKITLLVDDIDIPVEVKSTHPVQIEIDNDGIYRDIRPV